MPKKSKKGGKTEGDRMLYLQQRAQAEEEMAKKKEEILTLFLKDKLQKEEENTAVNLLKLNDRWRSIFRQSLSAELQREIGVMQQTFEGLLDGMDHTIKNLAGDLKDSERQSAQVRRAHLQQLERLWALQDKRMSSLQQQWENSLQQLSSRFSSDRAHIVGDLEKQRTELQDAALTLQRQHEDTMEDIHRVYSAGISALKTFVYSGDPRIPKTERQQQTEELYRKETKALEQLKLKNQTLVQDIKRGVEEEEKLQDSVVRMKLKIICNKKEHQTVEHDLIATTERLYRSTQQLNNQFVQSQRAARKQLTDLTVQSHAATKKLQGVVAKGEKVLRAGKLCRKLEGKVGMMAPMEEEEEAGGVEPEEVFPELRHLNRRINAAVLQGEALRKHREDVCRENKRLKLLLRHHLDGMMVTDQHQSHALLTVSPAPTSSSPPNTSRRHTVIEAVHVVQNTKDL